MSGNEIRIKKLYAYLDKLRSLNSDRLDTDHVIPAQFFQNVLNSFVEGKVFQDNLFGLGTTELLRRLICFDFINFCGYGDR